MENKVRSNERGIKQGSGYENSGAELFTISGIFQFWSRVKTPLSICILS